MTATAPEIDVEWLTSLLAQKGITVTDLRHCICDSLKDARGRGASYNESVTKACKEMSDELGITPERARGIYTLLYGDYTE